MTKKEHFGQKMTCKCIEEGCFNRLDINDEIGICHHCIISKKRLAKFLALRLEIDNRNKGIKGKR